MDSQKSIRETMKQYTQLQSRLQSKQMFASNANSQSTPLTKYLQERPVKQQAIFNDNRKYIDERDQPSSSMQQMSYGDSFSDLRHFDFINKACSNILVPSHQVLTTQSQ